MDGNLQPSKYDLRAVMDLLKKEIMLSLNCHAIGEVQSFNAVKQTVSVKINYKKTFYPKDGAGAPEYVDYPALVDCPVVIMGGGLAHLTFPIQKGDDCLVLFNDRNIDNWFLSGFTGPLDSNRLHSFSDAVALVGVNSLLDSLTSYDSTRAVLRYGATGAKVSVGPLGCKVSTATGNLGTQLDNLLTQLIAQNAALITAFGPGPTANPAAVTALTPITAALTLIKTILLTVLE